MTSTNNHVNSYEIDSMPMPPITFTTPKKQRCDGLKKLLKRYEASNYDIIQESIDNNISQGNPAIIHDFLGYLGKQMIKMNKKKNGEAEKFLKWLENEIGTEIDSLSNKTVVKKYYDLEFRNFLDILKANKGKITFDPSNRKKQELLEEHFNKSLAIISPLKEKISTTDNLIDQTVYKLYGLTEDEIKVVEETNK